MSVRSTPSRVDEESGFAQIMADPKPDPKGIKESANRRVGKSLTPRFGVDSLTRRVSTVSRGVAIQHFFHLTKRLHFCIFQLLKVEQRPLRTCQLRRGWAFEAQIGTFMIVYCGMKKRRHKGAQVWDFHLLRFSWFTGTHHKAILGMWLWG